MEKFTYLLKKCVIIVVGAVFMAFVVDVMPEESRVFINQVLNKHIDADAEGRAIKLFELNVTNTGFFRFRKIYSSGKTEFFALNLAKVNHVDYVGNAEKGNLVLHTKNDDVIVQTRNDVNGDLDTMGTCLSIPLKSMETTQLDMLMKKLSPNP